MKMDLITLKKRISMLELLQQDYEQQIEDLQRKGPTSAHALKEKEKKQTDPYKWRLSSRSIKRLQGVHPDLINVVERALQLSKLDFGITEGVRSQTRQNKLVAEQKSWVKVSEHQIEANKTGYGHAIDFAVFFGKSVNWDFENYRIVSEAFKQASEELDIPIIWGGDWERLRDGPHVQLG